MKSLDALYTVEFADPASDELRNGGVVVLDTNRVFGGDSGHYYLGDYSASKTTLTAKLTVVRYNSNHPNVWGDNVDEFVLVLQGRRSQDVIVGTMERTDVPGVKFPARLVRKANLP